MNFSLTPSDWAAGRKDSTLLSVHVATECCHGFRDCPTSRLIGSLTTLAMRNVCWQRQQTNCRPSTVSAGRGRAASARACRGWWSRTSANWGQLRPAVLA